MEIPLQPLYLDHAATTPLRHEVREAMEPYLADVFGNPSSAHAWGRRAAVALDEARACAAAALGASASEVYFVRGGTESDNLAVRGRAAAMHESGARTPLVVHSTIEHKAVIDAAQAAAAELGGRTCALAVDPDGSLDWGALERALDDGPAVVSVIWVNNEVGNVLEVDEVVRRCRARGVAVHSDAVQAVGKVPVRVGGDAAPDLLTVTGHKISGPKGTGLLYVRRGTQLLPLVFGGGQERGLRPGTEDVAGAWGMARALELAVAEQRGEADRLSALRDALEVALASAIEGVTVHGHEGPRAPHISNVGILGVDQEALLTLLDLEGVGVSSGSACNSGAARASHVLRALYGDRADGRATLRFSLGRGTGPDHVERAARVTAKVVERLRAHAAAAPRQPAPVEPS